MNDRTADMVKFLCEAHDQEMSLKQRLFEARQEKQRFLAGNIEDLVGMGVVEIKLNHRRLRDIQMEFRETPE